MSTHAFFDHNRHFLRFVAPNSLGQVEKERKSYAAAVGVKGLAPPPVAIDRTFKLLLILSCRTILKIINLYEKIKNKLSDVVKVSLIFFRFFMKYIYIL